MPQKKKKETPKEKRRRLALKQQKTLEAERLRREREPKKSKRWSRKTILSIAFVALALSAIGVYTTWRASLSGAENGGNPSSNIILLQTSVGDITIELYDDMPITTENFKNLVQQGVYDGTIFHRVIDGFMIQGGDPTGTGLGDPAIPTILDEFTDQNRNNRGTIAMANAGPNTGSSQFFINLVDNNYLDSEHPVFGRVTEGMDVVDAIGRVETDEDGRPLQDVLVIEAGFVD